MTKPQGSRRPATAARAVRVVPSGHRRFTPLATLAAERANLAGAISQFEPEAAERADPRQGPPAPAAVRPVPPPRVASGRDDLRRWPPTPIWLSVAFTLAAAGWWGASYYYGSEAAQAVMVSSSTPPPQAAAAAPQPRVETAATAIPTAGQQRLSPAPEAATSRVNTSAASAAPAVRSPASAAPSTRTPSRTPRPAADRPASTAAAARRSERPVASAPKPAAPAESGSPGTRARTDAPAPVVRPAAQPGFRGSLVIVSEPAGARVSVNGRLVGVTPLTLSDLPAGSRVVRVEADGYQPWSAAVRVVTDQATRITATLRP